MVAKEYYLSNNGDIKNRAPKRHDTAIDDCKMKLLNFSHYFLKDTFSLLTVNPNEDTFVTKPCFDFWQCLIECTIRVVTFIRELCFFHKQNWFNCLLVCLLLKYLNSLLKLLQVLDCISKNRSFIHLSTKK